MPVAYWGTVKIPGVRRVRTSLRQQQAPPIRTNPETTRNERQGVRALKLASFEKGLGIRRGTEAGPDIQRLRYSDGPWSQVPGGAFLPPVLTSQTDTADAAGARDANEAVHVVHSTLGQTKSRPYYFVPDHGAGVTKMFRTTSDSNPALTSAVTFSDTVTAAAEVVLNDTRGILVAFDGTTEDVQFITDPTASPPTRTTAFALTAGDRIDWICYKSALGPGFVLMGGIIGGEQGLHWLPTDSALLTAPSPVVLTATKDLPGDAAPVSTGAIEAGTGGSDVGSGDTRRAATQTIQISEGVDSAAWWDPWVSPTNVAGAQDTTYATAQVNFRVSIGALSGSSPSATAPSNIVSDVLQVSDYDLEDIPDTAFITGLIGRPRAKEAAAGDDLVWAKFQWLVNGSETGINLASAQELTTSDATYTFGGAANAAGMTVRGRDLKRGLGVAIQFMSKEILTNSSDDSTATATGTVSVDACPIEIYYTLPGETAAAGGGGGGGGGATGGGGMGTGGNIVGDHPLEENKLYIEAPEFGNEATGRNTPRILWLLDYDFDAEGDRPTVTITRPPTFLSHVEASCIAQAAVVCAGASGAGTGKVVRRLGRDGVPEDMQFGTAQGYTESWEIVCLEGNDKAFWALVALDSGTTCQWWICVNGAWGAYSKRFSTAALPLRLVGDGVDPTQRYCYTFAPEAANDTAIVRQYFALNPLADPTVTNATQVKEDGSPALTLQTPEFDAGGPEEALKVLLNAWYLGRDISSTNTVRLRYSVDGGANFTTWTTFTAALSRSQLSVPVLFRTVIFEVGLAHTAASSGTPNGLPLLIEMGAVWPAQRHWDIEVDSDDAEFIQSYRSVEGFEAAMLTEQALLPVQTLKPGNRVLARSLWVGLDGSYEGVDQPNRDAKPLLVEDRGTKTLSSPMRVQFDEEP